MSMIKTSIDEKELCREKVCPTCDGVECFERPRYFSGQLLTDKDLDAAQRYVIEKNKLHNRYLVGTGVVCGLAVRCDPCDPCSVTVEPGYAIDCCGNDIVLCEPAHFNVCEYIEKCLHKPPVCDDKIHSKRSPCDDLPKEYCLMISYNEEHTKPITALIRDNGCSASRCEPSRTKETFRFDLIEKKSDQDKDTVPHNDFWSKAKECIGEFLKQSKKFFDEFDKAEKNANLQVRHTAFLSLLCRLEDNILKLYRNGPNVRCTLVEELAEIEAGFPANTEDPQYSAKRYRALFRMYGRLLQFIIDCICNALLVPCTECGEEEGVLLACLTVRNGKIEKICNTVRKQVLTGPATRYWFQPIYTGIDTLLDYICCELDLGDVFDRLFMPQPQEQPTGPLPYGAVFGSNEEIKAETVRSTITRGESGIRMVSDYSAAIMKSLRTTNLLQFTNPNILTAMDIYNLPVAEVKNRLKNIKIFKNNIKEIRTKTHDEACKLEHLQRMSWIVPPGSKVELITSPDNLVTAIRVCEEEKK